MECPSCGSKIKEDAKLCVKCGEILGDAANGKLTSRHEVPQKSSRFEQLKYLKEFVPKREAVSKALPHPTGWILGIGLPVIACLAILHAVFAPGEAAAEDKSKAEKQDAAAALQKSEFKRCLAETRLQAGDDCGKITGTAQGLRRVSCNVAKVAGGYTVCTGKAAGRLGSCLKRCGQSARSCSSSCAIMGHQSWTETAKCLMPCWKSRLDACITTCF